MSDINITIEGGKSKRLLTKDKYCNDNILITALSDAPIKVKELPSDNIVEGKPYELQKTIFKDIIQVFEDGTIQSFAKYFDFGQLSGGLFVISTFTTENVVVTTDNVYGFYYVEDQQDVFVYADVAGDGNLTWVPATAALGIANNGRISHISEATEVGAYYILEESISYHIYNSANKGLDSVYYNGVPLEMLLDVTYSINNVTTTPTSDILLSNPDTGIFHFYYIEEYQDTFIYVGQWVPASQLIGTEIVYVDNLVDALKEDDTFYGLLSDGWSDYIIPTKGALIEENGSYDVTDRKYVIVDSGVHPEGTLEITENGYYDVTYYEDVHVLVSSNYIVRDDYELPYEAANGSLAFVLGGNN